MTFGSSFCKNYHCIHILSCMFRRDSWFQNHLFKFQSIFLIFPQTWLIFFLILALRVGNSPTRQGPGYATVDNFFVFYLYSLAIRYIKHVELNLLSVNMLQCSVTYSTFTFIFVIMKVTKIMKNGIAASPVWKKYVTEKLKINFARP